MGLRRVFRRTPEGAGTVAHTYAARIDAGPVARFRSVFESSRLPAGLVACVALSAATLAGCGFHLQGVGQLPEDARRVYVLTPDELTPFAVELRRAIERSGGRIAGNSAAADLVLRIERDRSGRRVLSVSARNTPQEYEIYYNVEYTLERGGQQLIERQPLELIRNLSFDQSQVLAKDREEAILRDAMARDLAMLVVRRLESLDESVPQRETDGEQRDGSGRTTTDATDAAAGATP